MCGTTLTVPKCQAFRQGRWLDSEVVACLCPEMAGAPAGRFKAWKMDSSEGLFIHPSGGCLAGTFAWNVGWNYPHVAWASSQHGGWVLRRVERERDREGTKRKSYCLLWPSINSLKASLLWILLVEVVNKVHPGSGWGTPSQDAGLSTSPCRRSTCNGRYPGVVIFGKYPQSPIAPSNLCSYPEAHPWSQWDVIFSSVPLHS